MTKTMFYHLAKATYRVRANTTHTYHVHTMAMLGELTLTDQSTHYLSGERPVPRAWVNAYAASIPNGGMWPTTLRDSIKVYINDSIHSLTTRARIYSTLIDFMNTQIPAVDHPTIFNGLPEQYTCADDLAALWSRMVWYVILLDRRSVDLRRIIMDEEVA